MAILKMSDGRPYVLKNLTPKGIWSKDSYGNEQLECTVEVLKPEEFNDGKNHLLYMSRAIFKGLEKAGLDRESTYTVEYAVRDGKKTWVVWKGYAAPSAKPPAAHGNGINAQDAILAAISLLEASSKFIEKTDAELDVWQLAVVAALLSGGKVKSTQTAINEHHEPYEPVGEVAPEW